MKTFAQGRRLKRNPIRHLITTAVIIAAALLLIAPTGLRHLASAQSAAAPYASERKFAGRAKHAQLAAGLYSKDAGEFRRALAAIVAIDEAGVNALWQTAVSVEDRALRQEAHREYEKVRLDRERKEFVPYVARIHASAEEVERVAKTTGVDLDIWLSSTSSAASTTSASSTSLARETTAAAPRYLLDAFEDAGISHTILYDSIADFERARNQGDTQALALATARRASRREPAMQVRVAVIDLSRTTPPQPGYSDWLGDHENVIRRNDSFIAYLEIFPSDGSPSSLDAHVKERYNRRGYNLAGFYTAEEFAAVIGRFFPGETFELPARRGRDGIETQAAEGRFHSYDETLAEFTRLARDNPGIAALVHLGKTYEGRDIFALKISKDPGVNDSTKTDVLITGCHHAREWISVEPPVYFANQLINGYAADGVLRHMVDRMQIWVVPIVNPDGLVYSQGSPNDQLDATRLWRKNRRPISTSACETGTGVDLNRNYNYQWRLRGDEPCPQTSDDSGASDNPNSEIFRGVEPESELEVRAIKSLINDPARRFRLQLDYHNYSQLILYPYSFQRPGPPDLSTLAGLAKQMSDEIKKVSGKVYRSQSGHELYTSTGTASDYSYGVSQVAAPFVVEMRPDCCSFNVPEEQVDEINRENWAGALAALKWASAPPILQSVRAFQKTSDGNFNKLVYAAQWVQEEGGRRLEVETRFPGVEVGPLQLRLQFSKPMDPTLNPRVTLGRNEEINELSAAALDATEGWQKTVYENDTWVGEVNIPQDNNETDAWRLAATASDAVPFKIDGKPATIARYGVGTNKWQDYEDTDGTGNFGGTDTEHRLSPTLRSDFVSLFVASPVGGERLAAGDSYTVAWTVPKGAGFTPAQQEVKLSTDGGSNFSLIGNVFGNVEKAQVTLPNIATTRARVRIVSREELFGNTIFGDNHADFTIGKNVGAGVEMTFVSAERIDQTWVDAPHDNPDAVLSGGLRLAVTVRVTNRGNVAIANPFLRMAEISRDNVLLSRDRKSKQIAGAHQTLDVGSDNLLSPGEAVETRLVVGCYKQKKFIMTAFLYGVPSGGTIGAADAVEIFRGKVKSK